MPVSVSQNDSPAERLRPYKNPEQCLTEFAEWAEKRKKAKEDRKACDPVALRKYEFTVQLAPFAIEEYEYWEKHDAWNGHHVWEETKKGGRLCRRDKYGKIVWVSPGLVFPVVGAMSEFVVESSPGRWEISKPSLFSPADMIAGAIEQFRDHDSDPMLMGRSSGAYNALRLYPGTIVKVMRDMKARTK
jgi:hypothetical protein